MHCCNHYIFINQKTGSHGKTICTAIIVCVHPDKNENRHIPK